MTPDALREMLDEATKRPWTPVVWIDPMPGGGDRVFIGMGEKTETRYEQDSTDLSLSNAALMALAPALASTLIECVEALQPFVEWLEDLEWHPNLDDGRVDDGNGGYGFTYGEVSAARAALRRFEEMEG